MKNQIGSEKLTGYKSGYKSDVYGVRLNGINGFSHQLRFNV